MGDVSNFPIEIGCMGGRSRATAMSLESISEYGSRGQRDS